MKILDKYIIKNFLIGYLIAFCALIGLRIVIDLFVNMDEFTEHADLGTLVVIKNILVFYGLNCTLYFRDFAGMIAVVAAAFSLGRMIRSNELVAVMASGVSLQRVMAPILILCVILTGVLVIDQEFLIPPLSNRLVRSHDDLPGEESYGVKFISDENGSLIFSQRFDVKSSTLFSPTIVKRKKIIKEDNISWHFSGVLSAEEAVYDSNTDSWQLTGGILTEKDSDGEFLLVDSYSSDITAKDIPVRSKSRNKTLLSWKQLSTLGRQGRVKDAAQLYSQMHFHITEPIINLVMIMVCLPVLICRDPKSMKSAVVISFGLTGMFFILTFACKMFSTEVVFGINRPEFWAWFPIFIFLPIAFIELDSMKT